MKNKTAVQWLIDEINEKHFFLFSKLGEQALKMEKEQICNAATWGGLHESAEQYYNETYNK